MKEAAPIRTLTPADVPRGQELSSLAGWNQTAADWSLLLKLAPETCFGIEIEKTLAATATLFCYGTSLAWVGMVLTHPNFRRRGLATQLLRHALAAADKLAIRTVKLDATEMGEPLYRSLGFAPEQSVERWTRSASRDTNCPASFSGSCSFSAEMDRDAFGTDRSVLLDALRAKGECYSNRGGYLLTRSGRNAAYLGPCVAQDANSARQLLDVALRSSSANGWCWDILPANKSTLALAKEFGFTPQRRLLRMFRGEPLRGREEFIYGIAGFEFG